MSKGKGGVCLGRHVSIDEGGWMRYFHHILNLARDLKSDCRGVSGWIPYWATPLRDPHALGRLRNLVF